MCTQDLRRHVHRTFPLVAEHDRGGHAPVDVPHVPRVSPQMRRDHLRSLAVFHVDLVERWQS